MRRGEPQLLALQEEYREEVEKEVREPLEVQHRDYQIIHSGQTGDRVRE